MNNRILIKLSGESLQDKESVGVSRNALDKIAVELRELRGAGYQVGIVLGGGNFFRGRQGKEALSIRRMQADQIGMFATLMNGLLLSEALFAAQIPHSLFSAVQNEFVQKYSVEAMQTALEKEGVVIFVGGTGHPYFTTDTAAALRATEMQASMLLKATTVDGIYNKDPKKEPSAVKYDTLSYQKALDEQLRVLDLTAFALCMENKIAIRVYKYSEYSFLEAAQNAHCGSVVK